MEAEKCKSGHSGFQLFDIYTENRSDIVQKQHHLSLTNEIASDYMTTNLLVVSSSPKFALRASRSQTQNVGRPPPTINVQSWLPKDGEVGDNQIDTPIEVRGEFEVEEVNSKAPQQNNQRPNYMFFSDLYEDSDSQSDTSSENGLHKRGNDDFEMLLKELKNILGMDSTPTRDGDGQNSSPLYINGIKVDHDLDKGRYENGLFELLLKEVKTILYSKQENQRDSQALEDDLSSAKKNNDFFELLLQEVKSILAVRRTTGTRTIQNDRLLTRTLSGDSLARGVTHDLTSSMLRKHFQNPVVSHKFRESLSKLDAIKVDQLQNEGRSSASDDTILSEEKVLINQPTFCDSDELDFGKTYSNSRNVSNDVTSNHLRTVLAVKSNDYVHDLTPYTVKLADIYPNEENFQSSEAWKMYRDSAAASKNALLHSNIHSQSVLQHSLSVQDIKLKFESMIQKNTSVTPLSASGKIRNQRMDSDISFDECNASNGHLCSNSFNDDDEKS